MLSFTPMKSKPFRKPVIRKFGDMSRLTHQEPPGVYECFDTGKGCRATTTIACRAHEVRRTSGGYPPGTLTSGDRVTGLLSFTIMTSRPFRKPVIRKFGDMSRLTQQEPTGTTKCFDPGQGLQGSPYDCL